MMLNLFKKKKKVILINYAGRGGSSIGNNAEKLKLGVELQKEFKEIKHLVFIENPARRDQQDTYHELIRTELFNYILNITSIYPNHDIYLIGNSAGASAILTILRYFYQIKKVFVACPSNNAGIDYINEGLKAYKNKIHFAVGLDDKVVDVEEVKEKYELSVSKDKHITYIKDCNHRFSTKENKKILKRCIINAFK